MVRISMHTYTDKIKQGNKDGTRLKMYKAQLVVNCLECTSFDIASIM